MTPASAIPAESATPAPPLTRSELYARVWTEPLIAIAAMYGISNVGLAKLCKRFAIPIPARGYWQKLWAGQPVEPLPLGAWKNRRREPVVLQPRAVRKPLFLSTTDGASPSILADRIVVASRLSVATVHPLVKRTRLAFPKSLSHAHTIVQPNGTGLLDVRVSGPLVNRALCLLNALITALEARGYVVSSRRPTFRNHMDGRSEITTWPLQARPEMMTCVQVADQDVLLILRELERKAVGPSASTSVSKHGRTSGRLALSIPHHLGGAGQFATWADRKRVKLEEQLHDVIAGIISAAQEYRDIESRWREAEKARHAEAVHRRELEQQRAVDVALGHALEQQATAWDMARTIREYVAAARGMSTRNVEGASLVPDIAPDRIVDEESWLAWAERYANRIDPLSS